MPTGESPRRLRDVSHLFLSENTSEAPNPAEKQTETSVWLAVETGHSLVRAFLASGFGASLARLGLHVTLLETGDGLPNLGYYFALEPSRHLAASLDRTAVISGLYEPLLRFASAPDATELARFRHKAPFGGYPHVIVTAFSYSGGPPDKGYLTILKACAGRFSGKGPAAELSPEAIVLFYGGDNAAETADSFRSLYPESVLFSAGLAGGVEKVETDEQIVLPSGYDAGRRKRAASDGAFFDDLASSLLQAVSHRRKRKIRNAAP